MSNDLVLELTTQVAPTKKFTVDGEEYDMFGFEHLSPADEAKITASLARYDRLQQTLTLTNDDREAEKVAVKLRDRRLGILSQLTSMSVEQVGKLPLPEQIKLMRSVQSEAGVDDEEDDLTT